jgi:acyl-CoA reductase-like NAD-dependent aldehyde dehydrogenase
MNQPKCVENIMKYSSATHALSVNPATGETLAAYPWATPEEVERAISQSDAGIASGDAKACPTGRRSCAISAPRCVIARKRWRR